ncbi:unnamed protein product [Lathyrus sativus]|nr:unnamed protein product [Lathyrus sativus]
MKFAVFGWFQFGVWEAVEFIVWMRLLTVVILLSYIICWMDIPLFWTVKANYARGSRLFGMAEAGPGQDGNNVISMKNSYNVRNGYIGYMEATLPVSFEADKNKTINIVCNSLIPSKIRAFSWILFLERLATKYQILKRGIRLEHVDGVCVLCNRDDKDHNHLFFDCPVAS